MTIDEAISFCEEKASNIKLKAEPQVFIQIAAWLEELKELGEYRKKMELQYLDDIDNPLEPLKLQFALQSEIFKYEYRKKNSPENINMLDYTIMHALKHCLQEQLKAGVDNE